SFTSRASSAQSVPAAKYTIPACTFRYFLHAATSSAAFAGEASVSLKKTLWASRGGGIGTTSGLVEQLCRLGYAPPAARSTPDATARPDAPRSDREPRPRRGATPRRRGRRRRR